MDTQKKHNLSGTIILVSCFLLLAGACDNSDRIETETQANGVLLNFNASTIDATTTETRSLFPLKVLPKTNIFLACLSPKIMHHGVRFLKDPVI